VMTYTPHPRAEHRMSVHNLTLGHIAHTWNYSLPSRGWFFFVHEFIRWILSLVPFPLFLTKLATITRVRSVVSHSFCPTTTHVITTHMYVRRSRPGVSWSLASLGSRCNLLLFHIVSRLSSSFFGPLFLLNPG
jgi:hypothetical protein